MNKKLHANIFRGFLTITLLSLALNACGANPTEVVPTQQPVAMAETTPLPNVLPQTNSSCRFATVFDPENFPCSVDQLKAITGFDLKAPAVDTSQFVFINAYQNGTSGASDYEAGLVYKCPNDECHLFIALYPLWDGEKTDIALKAPEGAVEIVQLKNGLGDYVNGWFVKTAVDQPETWLSDVGIQKLSWKKDKKLFTISLEGNPSEKPLGKEDLINLANSMR